MKYYFKTKSKGKCGCANTTWRVSDQFETKKAIKEHFLNVREVLTEKQLEDTYGETARRIKARAITW